MSKSIFSFCFLLLLVLTTLLNPQYTEAGRTVRVGVYETKPLAYSNKDGSARGFFVDMLNRVAEKEQWNMQYVPGTWQEGLDRLKSDKIDIVMCIAYTEAREKYMDFPKQFLLLDWGLIFKSKGSKISSLLDLEGKSVSALKGDVYLTGFRELVRQFNVNVKILEVDQYPEVFKAVESGAVAAGVNGNLYGMLNDTGLNLEQTPIIFTPVKLGYAVNKGNNGDLITVLDRHIAEMKADKTSYYYQELERLLGSKKTGIPKEMYWGLLGGIAALLLAITWNIMLKRQVRVKTEHLEAEITERKQIEENLNESKLRFQAFYDLGLVGLTITSPEKGWVNINDRLCNMLGYSETELRNMTWEQLTYPDDLAADVEQFERVHSGEIEGYELEKRFLTKTAEIIFTRLVVRCVRKPDQSVDFVVAMVQDITKSKQIENELRDAEWKFRALFNNGPIGVAYHSMIYDESGSPVDYLFIDANDNYLELTGVDPRGKTVTQAFPGIEKDPFNWIGVFGRVAKTGETVHIQQHLQSNDRWYDVVGYQYKPDHFVASFVEITDQKIAENALRESNDKILGIVNSVPGYVAFVNADTLVYEFVNQAFEKSFDMPRDKIIGSYVKDIIGEANLNFAMKYIETARSGKPVSYENTFNLTSGKRWLQVNYNPISDVDGRVVSLVVHSFDITHLKEHELEMLKVEKLESLGVLAGGIAHDFNNVLTGIMGNISLAKRFIDASHKSYNALEGAEKASVRATDLARQLLTFARGGEPVKKVVSVQNIVNESVSLVLHGSNVKSNVDIPDSVHAVEADEGQISQVLHNIIINATQAMPGGGILTVKACNETLEVDNSSSLPPGKYVCLSLTDEGWGISDEVMKKIFDPYFTTKASGSGLGLASVHSIISKHNGHIGVSSIVGKGTTFTIHLPSIGESYSEFIAEASTPDTSESKGGSVLVMDDEEIILDLISAMLQEIGYQVEICNNGKDAVECYKVAKESGTPFSAVIMDLTIPGGMGGKEAAEIILAFDPTACLIVSSGYSNDPIMSNYERYGFRGAIAKPYRLDDLIKILK